MESLRTPASKDLSTKRYSDALPQNNSTYFFDVNAATAALAANVAPNYTVLWDTAAAMNFASNGITLSADRSTLTLPAGQYDIRAQVLGGNLLTYQVFINGVAVPVTGTPSTAVSFLKVLTATSTLSVKVVAPDAVTAAGSRLTVRRFGF